LAPIMTARPFSSGFSAAAASTVLTVLLLVSGCREKEKPQGGAVDAAVATAPAEAGPAVADITQCAGCQLAPQQAWTFEGIYRDDKCTDPLAQTVTAACAVVPALGQTNLTYVDEVGARKAGEAATVTLVEQIPATTPRYRKTAKGCVRANEAATDITPMGCAGSRVCRDPSGALACTGCRTFANGCPDHEETRMYASINDPALKGATAAQPGGTNVARLRQCCEQLAKEAKRLGSSPEAGLLNTAAAQCNTLAAAAGPSGTAPELGALRSLLAGRTIPPVCAGF
jgi:hypothetical protein